MQSLALPAQQRRRQASLLPALLLLLGGVAVLAISLALQLGGGQPAAPHATLGTLQFDASECRRRRRRCCGDWFAARTGDAAGPAATFPG